MAKDSIHDPNTYIIPTVLLLVLTIFGVFAGFSQNKFQINSPVEAGAKKRVSKDSLSPKPENFVFFNTKVFLQRNKTAVTIPYSYDPASAPILFLGYTPQEDAMQADYLISHPQINQLNWQKLTSNSLTLFQKKPTYTSVKDFLSQPPELNTFVVDPTLKDQFPQLKGAGATDTEIDLESVDFILTSFVPSTFENEVWYYENVIDATTAKISETNTIEWYIKASNNNPQNPYLLGRIFIDYLQQ